MLLKQSTTATIKVGPVLDSTGAAYTGATIADFSLAKNGTDAALSSETLTHLHNGVYTIALSTTNTNTLGRIEISCNKTGGYGMAIKEAMVVPSATYDAIVTNGTVSTLDAAGIRTAVGLASANLDTQIATLSTLNAAGVRSAIGLASANLDTQLDALPTANEVRDAVFAQTVEGTYDFLECNRIYAAVLGGKSTVSTSSAVFRNLGDSKNVVDATLSSSSRTAITYDVT